MTMKDLTSNIVTSLGACVIAMMAFWMAEARNYVTRTEAIELIQTNSPYNADKVWITAEINRANESNRMLNETIQRHNEVTSQLKVEIAVLNKTLQTILDRDRDVNIYQNHGSFDEFVAGIKK